MTEVLREKIITMLLDLPEQICEQQMAMFPDEQILLELKTVTIPEAERSLKKVEQSVLAVAMSAGLLEGKNQQIRDIQAATVLGESPEYQAATAALTELGTEASCLEVSLALEAIDLQFLKNSLRAVEAVARMYSST